MKVVATQRGYYGQLIEIGQLFELDDPKHYSKRWMKKFDTKEDKDAEPVAKPRVRRKSKVIEPETLKAAGDLDAEGTDLNDWQE